MVPDTLPLADLNFLRLHATLDPFLMPCVHPSVRWFAYQWAVVLIVAVGKLLWRLPPRHRRRSPRAGLDGLAFREVRFAIKGPRCNRCDRRRCLIALSFCHQLVKSGSCSRNLVALYSFFGYCFLQVGKVLLCVLA